jgi:hypothetical protein
MPIHISSKFQAKRAGIMAWEWSSHDIAEWRPSRLLAAKRIQTRQVLKQV